MIKGKMFKSYLAMLQIILIVSITFSFSFVIDSSFVDAQAGSAPSFLYGGGGSGAPVPTTTPGRGIMKIAEDTFEGNAFQGAKSGSYLQGANHLISAALWAGIAAGVTYFVADALGASPEQSKAAAIAAAVGIGVARFGFLQASQGSGFASTFFTKLGFAGGGGAILWGVGIAAVTFVLLYKDTSQKYVQFQCLPFEAPLGGQSCEECNKDPLKPCSEYRCKALGQACGIVNEGTKEEKCVWISPDDVKSPIIQAWEDALTEGYSYTPDNAIRPPNRGVKIVNDLSSNQCVKPFTPLEFGITTDEPSRCKIDYVRTDKLDDMQFFFGESNLFSTNHTQTLRLPSPTSINNEAPELQNDGIYSLSVRCQDANGNENVDEFVFNFCVDPSPDTTPPLIEDSSIRSGSPVSFGAQNINISILVDEPAECKWSTQDKDYDSMENIMTCSTKVYQQNAQQLYPCATKLTGIVDKKANDFYFRCKDQPSKLDNERNVNAESYKLTLLGSQPLNIIDLSPNETITGSTDVVKINLQVETSNGAEEGKSVCYFSPSGEKTSYIQMFETNDAYHKQELNLPSGNYKYSFRCIDAGGNSDEAQTEFTVFTDRQAPKVTRAYKEGADALKLVTNEEAKCTYSINNCNFNINEGLAFIYADQEDKKEHFARWNPSSTYYIRCSDEFGNEPATNSCSLIASATNVF